jgi:hypothetical protein
MSHVYQLMGVHYVVKGKAAPGSWKAPTTCGTCGRTWDDSVSTMWTPVPSARCPFEYKHYAPIVDQQFRSDTMRRVREARK